MIRASKWASALLFLIALCSGTSAQELASERAEAILNDKSGKYVFLDNDTPLLLENDWFSKMRCAAPTSGMVSVKVGQSLFRIPQASLRSVLAGAPLLSSSAEGKFRTWHLSNTGCPENPILATVAEVVKPASGAADTLGLKETPKRSDNGGIGATLRNLRDNPNANCAPLGGEFISCTGQVNAGVTSFIMAREKDIPLQSNGAPLSLRCQMQPAITCGLDDDLPGGITMVATLPGGNEWMRGMTVQKVSAYYQEVRAIVDGLRVRN